MRRQAVSLGCAAQRRQQSVVMTEVPDLRSGKDTVETTRDNLCPKGPFEEWMFPSLKGSRNMRFRETKTYHDPEQKAASRMSKAASLLVVLWPRVGAVCTFVLDDNSIPPPLLCLDIMNII